MTPEMIKSIVDQLTLRQGNRLLASGVSTEEFFARPEEEAVCFEVDCYMNLLEKTEGSHRAA